MQKQLQSNLLLLLTAFIWGLAFVAQRIGAQYVGSFTFNGIRFALGSFSLLPLILWSARKNQTDHTLSSGAANPFPAGIIAGTILFIASSLQQSGIVDSSAGKAAFITGLYMVIVPLIGIFLRHRIHLTTWVGVIVATAGLYLLSVTEHFTIATGDLIVFIGSFLWAAHILTIDHFIKKVDALMLSFIQFLTCSFLSMVTAFIFEKITYPSLLQALIPILYCGIGSVGIAYTLQVFGQKHTKPSHAAIILCMETVFGALGGLIILHEDLGIRGYIGCLLMLAGMLLSQFPNLGKNLNQTKNSSC